MKTNFLPFVLVGAVAVASGCTFPSRNSVYDRRQINQAQRVEYGTIEEVRGVTVQGREGPIGTYGGAAVGAAATSQVGHGAGRGLAQAGGAIAGAVAGQAVEEAATRKAGLEMTIRLDDGKIIVVAQQLPPNLTVGDRVRILSGGGETRVAMETSGR